MHKAWLTSSLGTISAVLLSAGLIVAGPAFAADTTVTVDQDGEGGWLFNRDASTSTPYEFTADEASIGRGSLYVLPIENSAPDGADPDTDPDSDPNDKFIAEQFAYTPVDDVQSIAYDFMIAGSGTEGDASQFFLNVYVNLPGQDPDNYYDCRFDYVPTAGSAAQFTKVMFDGDDVPVEVRSRGGAVCPAASEGLEGLPDGSLIRMFSVNVGDTSADDTGLAGYLDNVVLSTTGGSTTWDFESNPTSKDDCKKDGYMSFGFKNQGECIAWWNSPKG